MPNYLENPKTNLDLFRQKVYIIIYGVNTPAGKAFDVGLLIMIFLSVFTIVLETVEGVDQIYHQELIFLEWFFTYIEGPENGFTSIPKSIFYTIVTLTTVGYGDMVPTTVLGQFFSMILMVTGYGIIAVPTGTVGVEIAKEVGKSINKEKQNKEHNRFNGIVCAHCNKEGHRDDAEYCYSCGHSLHI